MGGFAKIGMLHGCTFEIAKKFDILYAPGEKWKAQTIFRGHPLFENFVISELLFLLSIVILSLGAMVYLTFWLVNQHSRFAFLAVIWIGYGIIIVTGGSTVLHALQKERLHWTRFFISTCQLFGSLVQSAGHDQIEFS